jgi:hypothetical protein
VSVPEENAARVLGHSKDHRDDLPQVVIGMAVTRDGIPVRCWAFPGSTSDQEIIRRIKDDLGGWNLRRLIWGVCQIFFARGLFAVRLRVFIRNRFLALSDVVLPGLARGFAEPDFPCRSGADAACPGFPGVLCCCGRLLPDPPGIAWRAVGEGPCAGARSR